MCGFLGQCQWVLFLYIGLVFHIPGWNLHIHTKSLGCRRVELIFEYLQCTLEDDLVVVDSQVAYCTLPVVVGILEVDMVVAVGMAAAAVGSLAAAVGGTQAAAVMGSPQVAAVALVHMVAAVVLVWQSLLYLVVYGHIHCPFSCSRDSRADSSNIYR